MSESPCSSPRSTVTVGTNAVVRPKRGSGRLWRVGEFHRLYGWRLDPLGGDVGGFGGVKSLWRSDDQLASWEVVRWAGPMLLDGAGRAR